MDLLVLPNPNQSNMRSAIQLYFPFDVMQKQLLPENKIKMFASFVATGRNVKLIVSSIFVGKNVLNL